MTLILLYHRIADPADDFWSLSVEPQRFAEQVSAVVERYEVVPLQRALDSPGGQGPRIVFTFDDGYADNLAAARILAERGAPSTFFLTVDPIQSGRSFWWDRLATVMFRGALPDEISLDLAGEQLTFDLARTSTAEALADSGRWRGWREASTPLEHAYTTLYRRLRLLDHPDRERVLGDLARVAGCSGDDPSNRPLTLEELEELATLEGVEVGAHTLTHPQLSALPSGRQRAEIEGGREALETLIGRPVDAFAFPYGRPGGDYDAATVEIVAATGFRFACASEGGAIKASSVPLDLPRFLVADWEADDLIAQIEAMLRRRPARIGALRRALVLRSG